MAQTIFFFFFRIPYISEEGGYQPVCSNGTANFYPVDPTSQTEWATWIFPNIPEYSGRMEPKLTFPFDFKPKFPDSLA